MKLLNPLPQRLDTGATPTFAGLLAGDGTAAAPSIAFASDTDTGFYRGASNFIGIAIGGQAKGNFQDSGGFILQGSSGSTLHFINAGQIALAAAGTNQNITLTPSGTGVVEVISGANSNNGRIQLGTGAFSGYISNEASSSGALALNSTGSVAFRIAGVDGATLLTNRRFLIGTSTDSGALLQVGTNTTNSAGGMVFGADCFLYRGGANVIYMGPGGILGTPSGTLGLATAGAVALTLDASQAATFASSITTTNGTITANSGAGAVSIAGSNTSATGFGAYVRGGSTQGSGKYLLQLVNYDASKNYLFYDNICTMPGALTLGGALKLSNAYVAGAVVGTGYVTIQDSTGTTYRVPVLV